MKAKHLITFCLTVLMAISLVTTASAQADKNIQQSEKEFEQLMPITGTVETFFGKFEIDHSFPTKATSERIYDLMDYSRVAQLYLWGLPITSMTHKYVSRSRRITRDTRTIRWFRSTPSTSAAES